MIEGINIREVWDFRLSRASVYIDRRGGSWMCVVISKDNPDYSECGEVTPVLETHDTGIKAAKNDLYDKEKLKVCFEWFKTIRDNYALPNIEELKPIVSEINRLNEKLAAQGAVK
ncbi:hypothetical protein OAP25_02205 [Flavobacteriaceae bacterium]|nr:hypothetical protein [Flavobacteriaceae bacterium]